MKERKIRLAAAILYGIAAAIWIVTCVRDFLDDERADGLVVATTILFIIAFIVMVKRYLDQK